MLHFHFFIAFILNKLIDSFWLGDKGFINYAKLGGFRYPDV